MFTQLDWLSPSAAKAYLSNFTDDESRILELLFRSAVMAKIVMPSGNSVYADRDFLSSIVSRRPFLHAYVNVRTGEVGQGGVTIKSALMALLSAENYLRRRNGFVFIFSFVTSITALAIVKSPQPLTGIVAATGAVSILVAFFCITLLLSIHLMNAKFRRDCAGYVGGHLLFSYKFVEKVARHHFPDDHEVGDVSLMPRKLSDAATDVDPETACAFDIVAEQDRISRSGGKLTKEDARDRLSNGLGTRAFDRAWNDARRMRPELTVGGRPSKKSTDTD